ncbi:uncharacterized protein LOC120358431 [Solenopsis invicta]|uniref:uncharacterized protein LOC120358431 n=1 Tax=Solenopsis invicta TaxID=13686 RepID=UPI00193D88FC|nr:uncharacterized protein LOC120358431 [Solenopsis invicta]
MQRQNRFSVIIFFVVVLSILHSSKARKCYGTTQGESYEEMECPPNMPLCVKYSNSMARKCYGTTEGESYEEMECPPNMPLCVKISSDYIGDNIRGCAVENFCEISKDWVTECYECQTDLCNK